MIIEITRNNHDVIKNPVFAAYSEMYLKIYDNFMEQIQASGIAIDSNDYQAETDKKVKSLRGKGATIRNGGKSIYVNAISPACIACKTGVDSETFFISLECHRDCYFCFNPNQIDYEYYRQNKRDVFQELDRIHATGAKLTHLAITGGEPLLHSDDVVNFYTLADRYYPGVHKRLYTCGDHVDDDILQKLHDAGLEEIRFSIRLHDMEKGHHHTLDRIALAKQYIPDVMVEMPVLPGSLDTMQALLLDLNELQISSINLLEFCYPFSHPEAFNQKGFKLKKRPYRIPYNYWYAGGLPISQSELACLDLLDFALEHDLSIGIHYCSLENKFTAQIYEQNHGMSVPDQMHFSTTDYFYKSAKVFGEDIPQVLRFFERKKLRRYIHNEPLQYLEFHVEHINKLRVMDVEIGITTSVVEKRESEFFIRELKVDLTYPGKFNLSKDV
jgi:pyruvate formate-lyase activating enzyme-like uncharacterized protein